MKSCLVDTITSNEDHVRMRIYDGDLKIDEASAELLRIERAQNDSLRAQLRESQGEIGTLLFAWTKSIRTRAMAGESIDMDELVRMWPTMRMCDFSDLSRGELLNGRSSAEVKAAALKIADGSMLRRA